MSWDSEGLYPVKIGNKVGFIDASGNVKIPARENGGQLVKRTEVPLFSEGLAPFLDLDNKYGYIDKTGNFAIAPQFETAGQFRDGFALVTIKDRDLAYIDHQGKPLSTPRLLNGAPFSEGFAAVNVGDSYRGKWGYIDKTGRLAIAAQFDFADRFAEGLAAVGIGGKNSFIDKTGKVRIDTGDKGGVFFSEGLAQVTDSASLGARCGFIDGSGKVVIKPQWPCLQMKPFHEGRALVYDGNKGTGFIDRNGTVAIPYQFGGARSFSAGRAAVQTDPISENAKWGYIDTSGKLVIDVKFDVALPFFPAGIALVMLNGETRYIDVNGKYIWNPPQ